MKEKRPYLRGHEETKTFMSVGETNWGTSVANMNPAPHGKFGRTSLSKRNQKTKTTLTPYTPYENGATGRVNELSAAFHMPDHLFVVDREWKLELQLQA